MSGLLVSSIALADGKTEASARQLQKKAMEEDYLATDFAKAQEKLKEAITKCGDNKCSAVLRAQLRRDLGVVLIGGQIDREKGTAAFAEAIAIDASLQLDPDLKTKELEAAWQAAHKAGAATPSVATSGSTTARPAGDFTHTPAAGQAVRTPLPIYVEYAGSEALVKVIARYKGFGMTEFKTIQLTKIDAGWGGLVPCADMQQGDILYYLQGFNEANDPVATAGDRAHPYKVPVKSKFDGEAPHLPGQAPPSQCAETGDCPPDFPGCKTKPAAESKPEEAAVSEAEPDGKDEGGSCEEDNECKSSKCNAGKCTEYSRKKKFRRHWVGISFGFDLIGLGSANNACQLNNDTGLPVSSFYCTRDGASNGMASGTDYPARSGTDPTGAENKSIVTNRTDADAVKGGAAIGGVRIALSYDYALTSSFLLGARVGLITGGYPGDAASKSYVARPLELELRGTYLFGASNPLEKSGLSGAVVLGVGLSQYSAGVGLSVVEQNSAGTLSSVQAKAWKVSGPFYVAPGIGVRYAFTERAALLVIPARVALVFGSNGTIPAFSPELALQFGF